MSINEDKMPEILENFYAIRRELDGLKEAMHAKTASMQRCEETMFRNLDAWPLRKAHPLQDRRKDCP